MNSESKQIALMKITGTASVGVETVNASCGKCNKTYSGKELKEEEKKIDGRFKYRLRYLCPKGHVVLGADA